MNGTLESRKAHQHPSGPSRFYAYHSAHQVKGNEQREYANDRNAADPAQRHLVEMSPVAAGGLLDGACFLIRDRAATGNPIEFAEKRIFLDRARGRID